MTKKEIQLKEKIRKIERDLLELKALAMQQVIKVNLASDWE